jgi:O-antigen/teichoic acid export membrane protein
LFLQFNLPYSEETKSVLRIMSLAIFPESVFSLCQSYFIAHERQAVPTLAAFVNAVIRLGLGVFLLQNGAGAVTIAWVIPISTLLSLLAFPIPILGLTRRIPQSVSSRFDLRFVYNQLLLTPSFLVIHLFSIVDYQTDTFMISIMLSEEAIGWYGAAQTILLGFWVIPRAIRSALYPLMATYYVHAPDKLDILYEKAFQYSLIFSLPMVVGVFLLAEEIIFLVFGPSFAPAVPVLKWSIWGVVFSFLNVPNARLMLLNNQQRTLSWLTGISTLTNVGLNILLIPRLGIVGAAIARLFASFVLFLTIYLYVRVRIGPDARPWQPLPRAALAVSLMAVTVFFLREMQLIWSVTGGVVVFILSSFVFGVIPAQDWTYWRSLLRKVDFTK